MDTRLQKLTTGRPHALRRPGVIAALALAACAATTAQANPPMLVGVWNTTVQPSDCESWEAVGDEFRTLNAYFADGIAQEIQFSDDPNMSRSLGVGTWKKVGKRTFAIHSENGLKDSSGNNFGYIVLNRTVTVAKDGLTLEGKGQGSFYLNDGQLLGSSCGMATSERQTGPAAF